MEVLRIDAEHPEPELLERAAEVLRRGGLVSFPTETVYGLGADARNEEAVRGIFTAKGRPSFNPLIVHVADLAQARELSSAWPDAAERLGSHFWPGPVTVVVPKRPEIPDLVTAGLPSVALRVPAHPVAHALLRHARIPVAAPSANRYTQVSPTRAEHVVKGLADRVDLVLDGGPTNVGIESTVIDVTGPVPVLLRPGSIARAELEAVVGPLARPVAREGETPRPSPGMVRRHYSPRAELLLYTAERRAALEDAARAAAAAGRRVGALLLAPLDAPIDARIEMPTDPGAYASRLYAALHDLDDAGCDVILADAVPEAAEWAGVRDRLSRAAER
jgi:L-threonylcarbamoyladenylate synthase